MLAKDDVRITSMPDRMINNGQCKSRILVSVTEKGKPRPKTWIYVGSTAGEMYALEDTKAEEAKSDDFPAIKVRTDKDGKASLGLNLPSMVGRIRLAAAAKLGDVKESLEGSGGGEVGTCQIALESDKPARMVLESELREVVADGVSTARVSALIMDQHGNPIQGQEVSFQAEKGTIDPDSVNSITDENGRAYASISSQQVGLTKVKAVNRYKSWLEDVIGIGDRKPARQGAKNLLGSMGGEETLKAEIEVRFVPSHASSLIINVDRSTVPADGKEQACVTAQLKDEFGNPVQGRKMVFETDLGELHPSREVTTDSEGKAVVLLSSGHIGPASVRVRTEEEENLLSATQVVFEAASPAVVQMEVTPEEARADGEAECIVKVEVRDEMGNPVPGKVVTFVADLGSLSDENRTTDADGCAEMRIMSRRAGIATVRATCGEARGETQITFMAGKPSSVAISLNPTVEESWRSRIPSDHWERLQRALRHLEERRFADAIAIMEAEESRARQTCDYSALCNLAFAYQQSGQKEKARELYGSIIERNGSRKEIHVKADGMEEVFGVVLPDTNGGVDPGAMDYLAMDPRDYLINIVVTDAQGNQIPDIQVEFGSNFGWVPEEFRSATTNQLGAATSLVTTFAPSGSSEVEFAWVNLGLIRENALDYSGAEECYRSAVKAMPESTRGLESLASVLVKTGEIDDAKKCYFNLGRAYSKRGNLSKALEYYGKAIELDPKYAKALAGYGAVCLKVGELERARRYLEESVKLDKSMKAALANLGLAYYLKGDFDKAIQMNKRALKLDSEFKTALLNLYQIHMASGEREKAAEYASQIRKLGA